MLTSLLANISVWVQAGDSRSLTSKSINCDKRVTVTYGEALWSPRVEEDAWGRTDLGGDPFPKARVRTPLEKLWYRPQGDRDVCWFTWAGAGLWSLGKQDTTI